MAGGRPREEGTAWGANEEGTARKGRRSGAVRRWNGTEAVVPDAALGVMQKEPGVVRV